MLLDIVLKGVVKKGRLTLIDHRGRTRHYGEAEPADGRHITIRVHTAAAARRLALNPNLALGELYMNGEFTVQGGSIYDFLELAVSNLGPHGKVPLSGLVNTYERALRLWHQFNAESAAKKRVQHHYDLDGRLYDLFLDTDKQYSCAYFPTPDATLEQAQLAKKRHIAAKLKIEPGMKVLDIGCGWGGLGLYLAETCGADVTGITLSEEQHAIANRRAQEKGLTDRVRFQLMDYRNMAGQFDRIVSVGMFEHVGVPFYGAYFRGIHRLLKDDGVALVHSIGRSEGPGVTAGFIRKYIFPGGYIPALSEVIPEIEKSQLWVTDLEILRLHYAETLRHWRMRFLAQWDKAKALYDERFCRMWEFYLAASEVTFRYWGQMVFQVQLTKSINTLPITRDYMFDGERALAGREVPQRPFAKTG
ncbi:MAG TPA: cyclopropane-fatty-acyl-phospholipid synthase family protein [Ferrovibrio sp.]|uniref:cyclopropane-fatty-acyl-phospholipid synthase family protein n=1 Tax=Ferrovibrio sp. TaxID=1917215 RepID=UPI002B4AC677|nr:cyclopropane-fatty-acyl-phospholipid synthase family protein [Ferrovibrio sp.]HLT77940.1 cyclopropane-fatty-acyl-phospholipid synthase family protein [Ferrovibrio sp.]